MQESLLQCAEAALAAGNCIGFELKIRPKLFGRQVVCRAVFKWPGVVRVMDAGTGELLAISRPGRPLQPATTRKRKAP